MDRNRLKVSRKINFIKKGIKIMMDKKDCIDKRGQMCPFCKGASLQGGFVQVEKGEAFQKMDCLECEKSWTDVYRLVDALLDERGT